MKFATSLAFLLAIGLFATLQPSCYYDNEADLCGSCDTTNVTYNGQIKSLMDNKCATVGCHQPGAGNPDPSLDTYDNIYAYAKTAGKGTEILKRINSSGDDRMPPTGLPLDTCSINTITSWLAAGLPQ